jgi:hypothetical protein
MTDDPKRASPADPFTALETGAAAVLEMFRSYRRAGASLAEAAFIVAAVIVVNGRADGHQ